MHHPVAMGVLQPLAHRVRDLERLLHGQAVIFRPGKEVFYGAPVHELRDQIRLATLA